MPHRPINENVLYPGCKETLSPVIFRKICGPHWNRVISMILALRNNSATWFKKYSFKSSAIDTRYLVSLAIYFRWYGFLENFFASSSLQQFQVKSSRSVSELKLLSFWKATPPPTPSPPHPENLEKQNLVSSSHILIETTIEQRLIIELEEKRYCISISMVWWHGFRDYRVFRK